MIIIIDDNTSPIQKGIKGENVDFAFKPSVAEGPKKSTICYLWPSKLKPKKFSYFFNIAAPSVRCSLLNPFPESVTLWAWRYSGRHRGIIMSPDGGNRIQQPAASVFMEQTDVQLLYRCCSAFKWAFRTSGMVRAHRGVLECEAPWYFSSFDKWTKQTTSSNNQSNTYWLTGWMPLMGRVVRDYKTHQRGASFGNFLLILQEYLSKMCFYRYFRWELSHAAVFILTGK